MKKVLSIIALIFTATFSFAQSQSFATWFTPTSVTNPLANTYRIVGEVTDINNVLNASDVVVGDSLHMLQNGIIYPLVLTTIHSTAGTTLDATFSSVTPFVSTSPSITVIGVCNLARVNNRGYIAEAAGLPEPLAGELRNRFKQNIASGGTAVTTAAIVIDGVTYPIGSAYSSIDSALNIKVPQSNIDILTPSGITTISSFNRTIFSTGDFVIGNGLRLPVATSSSVGKSITVKNIGTHTFGVYRNGTNTIDGSATVFFSPIAPNNTVTFVVTATGAWRTIDRSTNPYYKFIDDANFSTEAYAEEKSDGLVFATSTPIATLDIELPRYAKDGEKFSITSIKGSSITALNFPQTFTSLSGNIPTTLRAYESLKWVFTVEGYWERIEETGVSTAAITIGATTYPIGTLLSTIDAALNANSGGGSAVSTAAITIGTTTYPIGTAYSTIDAALNVNNDKDIVYVGIGTRVTPSTKRAEFVDGNIVTGEYAELPSAVSTNIGEKITYKNVGSVSVGIYVNGTDVLNSDSQGFYVLAPNNSATFMVTAAGQYKTVNETRFPYIEYDNKISGATLTPYPGVNVVYLTNTATLASLTIKFPEYPYDGQEYSVAASGVTVGTTSVTSLTWTGASRYGNAPTTLSGGDVVTWVWDKSELKWKLTKAPSSGGGAASLQATTDIGNITTNEIKTLRILSRGLGDISTNFAGGTNALAANTTGNNNTAVGNLALNLATTAVGNSAFGSQALNNLLTGQNNTALGYQAMLNNTASLRSTAVGSFALRSSISDANNTAVGSSALYSTNGGVNNVGVGYQVLFSNTTGSSNTAIGAQSQATGSTGSFNTSVGAAALTGVKNSNNSAFGTGALQSLTFGDDNVAIGYAAMNASNEGIQNVVIGSTAGSNIGNNTNNILIGYGVLRDADNANNTLNIGNWIKGVDGKISLPSIPTYANDAAADADATLRSGGLYKITGSRVVYVKP